jgi:hypothetical protein
VELEGPHHLREVGSVDEKCKIDFVEQMDELGGCILVIPVENSCVQRNFPAPICAPKAVRCLALLQAVWSVGKLSFTWVRIHEISRRIVFLTETEDRCRGGGWPGLSGGRDGWGGGHRLARRWEGGGEGSDEGRRGVSRSRSGP